MRKLASLCIVCCMSLGCGMSVISCKDVERQRISMTLEQAGNNRGELEKVLRFYETRCDDEEKLKAARFLIANMYGWKSMQGGVLEEYKRLARSASKPIPLETFHLINKRLKHTRKTIYSREDAQIVSSDYLIRHIESCIDGWRCSPWSKEIGFEEFCNYILPYRMKDEQLSSVWIDSLRNRYSPYIEDVTDIKQAFRIVNEVFYRTFRTRDPGNSFNPDILTLDNIKSGICKNECVLLGAICRSLSIPVAYDYVNQWSNYSRKGHSWVSMVLKDTVYTWDRDKRRLRNDGYIPASRIRFEYTPDSKYFYNVDTLKKAAKVYRLEYGRKVRDVSYAYDMRGTAVLEIEKEVEKAYLCIFRTGGDWILVAVSEVEGRQCRFENLGFENVYLLMAEEEGEGMIPLSDPFLLHRSGDMEFFTPDRERMCDVSLTRKYPLLANWSDQYKKMVGGHFEGANDAGFAHAVMLGVITEPPVYCNEMLPPASAGSFRYIRYVCPEHCRTPLAEMEVYDGEKEQPLSGIPMGKGVKSDSYCRTFDRNRISTCSVRQEQYWVGLDMLRKYAVTRIVFFPKNDGNFVEPGDCYELFYYDKGWKSLGERVADGYALDYTVPCNALLWLRDKTKGQEERIFTCEGGRQVWW